MQQNPSLAAALGASKPASKASDLPLEVTESTEIDPVTGAEVKIVVSRRGILRNTRRTYTSPHPDLFETGSSRQWLEQLRETLRDRLEKQGVPSDRNPHWIKLKNGEWVESKSPKDDFRDGELRPCALWTARVRDLSKPLSKPRAMADLLFYLNQLLSEEHSESTLYAVCQMMESWSELRLLGPINTLATAGLKARNARALGPAIRRARTLKVREIISDSTEEFWREKPKFRGDASNTAAHLAESINRRLKEELDVPPKKPLSTKTIADHIRRSLKENNSCLAKTDTKLAIAEIG